MFSEVDAREKHKCFIYGLPGDEYHDLLKVRREVNAENNSMYVSYSFFLGIITEMFMTY